MTLEQFQNLRIGDLVVIKVALILLLILIVRTQNYT